MTTQPLRFALLGHPVAHSLSPAIHECAYSELGLPHTYELCDAPDEAAVREVVGRLRSGYFAGLNVTVPWKRLALELCDRADPLAEELGAANVLRAGAGGALEAYNTDVLALHEELSTRAPGASSVCIIGSGGAALAALSAARKLGAREIFVVARGFRARVPEDGWAHAAGLRALGARTLAWPDPDEPLACAAWERHASESRIIVQATSAGMHGADSGEALAGVVPWAKLRPDTLAYDVVYNPRVTPFLRRAEAAGLPSVGGLGMLVGQAAHAFEIWLSRGAPREPMARAAELALQGRARP
jgi:shikimate dehydrogenase